MVDENATPPLVDLHCHLLPGVDDGSATAEQSAEVAGKFWDDGVRGVCLTPHISLGRSYGERRAELVALFADAYEALRAATEDLPMRFWSGAEVMVEEPPKAQHDLTAPFTLGTSSAMLIEFPILIGAHAILRTVHALRDRAIVPLIAHPERYECCTPEAVHGWREAGAWIQADATATIEDAHERGEKARALLRLGLVDVLAGDNHGDDRSLARTYQYLVAAGQASQAGRLCSSNPRALLHDAPRPAPVRVELEGPPREPESLLGRLRRIWRGE